MIAIDQIVTKAELQELTNAAAAFHKHDKEHYDFIANRIIGNKSKDFYLGLLSGYIVYGDLVSRSKDVAARAIGVLADYISEAGYYDSDAEKLSQVDIGHLDAEDVETDNSDTEVLSVASALLRLLGESSKTLLAKYIEIGAKTQGVTEKTFRDTMRKLNAKSLEAHCKRLACTLKELSDDLDTLDAEDNK